MRDYTELEKEIDRVRDSSVTFTKKREISSARKRVVFLSLCSDYLKTNPTTEFLEKEYERLDNRLKKIEKDYAEYKPMNIVTEKNKRIMFEKLNNIPLIRQQLMAIRFILQ